MGSGWDISMSAATSSRLMNCTIISSLVTPRYSNKPRKRQMETKRSALKFLTPNHWPSYVRANRLRILMYHRISESAGDRLAVTPERFVAQMDFLAGHKFQILSLQEAQRRLSARDELARTVVLTFDDGYRDFLTTAAPILK